MQIDHDATTTVADWIPIITARIVAVLTACDALADAIRNGAGDTYVDLLRHRTYQAIVRLDEVAPIRDELLPEYRAGLDLALERAETGE